MSKQSRPFDIIDAASGSVVGFPKSRPDGIQVYQLVFPDHVTYVGASGQRLSQRLAEHRVGGTSRGVQSRMDSLEAVRLHSLYAVRVDAWAAERVLCASLRLSGWTVLNRVDTPAGFSLCGERVHGKFRCRICNEWKIPDAFHKDPSRSSGRGNKCSLCLRSWHRVSYHARKLGLVIGDHPVLWRRFKEFRGRIDVSDYDWKKMVG